MCKCFSRLPPHRGLRAILRFDSREGGREGGRAGARQGGRGVAVVLREGGALGWPNWFRFWVCVRLQLRRCLSLPRAQRGTPGRGSAPGTTPGRGRAPRVLASSRPSASPPAVADPAPSAVLPATLSPRLPPPETVDAVGPASLSVVLSGRRSLAGTARGGDTRRPPGGPLAGRHSRCCPPRHWGPLDWGAASSMSCWKS